MGMAVEIYERPANRFVADFIGESNFLDGKVKSVKENQAVCMFLLGAGVNRSRNQ